MIELKNKTTIKLKPLPPYNFDANFHKPSHFPSSDNVWKKGRCWISMIWKGQALGLKFENKGSNDKPKIKLDIYSQKPLTKDFVNDIIPEIRWRFNFDSNISEFCKKFKNDKILGSASD